MPADGESTPLAFSDPATNMLFAGLGAVLVIGFSYITQRTSSLLLMGLTHSGEGKHYALGALIASAVLWLVLVHVRDFHRKLQLLQTAAAGETESQLLLPLPHVALRV